MLITLIALLLISNALSLRTDKSKLFTRLVMVALIHTSFLAYNNSVFISLDKEIGIFGSLFHVTVLTPLLNIFFFLLAGIILTLTSIYVRKVVLNKIYHGIVFGLLILLSIKIPFKFMLTALSCNYLYFIVIMISSVLVYCIITLYKQGEYLKAVEIIFISISSLATYLVFLLLLPDISFIAQCMASSALPNLGLQVLEHSSLNLFSESNGQAPNDPVRTSNEWRSSREASVNQDESVNEHLNKSVSTLRSETRYMHRSIIRKTDIICDNVTVSLDTRLNTWRRDSARETANEMFESLTDDYHFFNAVNNTLVKKQCKPFRQTLATHLSYEQARVAIDAMYGHRTG